MAKFTKGCVIIMQDEMYIRKLWLVFISGKVVLWRYIAVWLIAVSIPENHNCLGEISTTLLISRRAPVL